METPRFNIPSTLVALYGIARPITFPGYAQAAERDNADITFAGVRVVEDDEVRQVSAIGTPIFHPITLRGGTYRTYDSQGRIVERTLGDLRLPISSVIEMSQTKTVTKTQVSASGATVKEVYAFGDWDVRITGIMFDEKRHPHGAVDVEGMEERILEFNAMADSIGVDCDLLNRRGVDRLVIRSINFQAMPGRPRMIGYQLQCDSDAALELMIQ